MQNLIVVGDTHIRFTAPICRKTSYYEEMLNKIDQINKIAKDNDAKIICLGDFFNNYVEDYFEKIVYDLSDKLKNWYTLLGNHDCKSVDGDVRGTSLGVLIKTGLIKLATSKEFPEIDFFHYYNRNEFTGKSKNKIAFIHDYIMPKGTKEHFEYKECDENDYSLVFCGHYHYSYDIITGKTRYINPGSLMRSTITEKILNRTPEIVLLKNSIIKHIPLKVKPLEDILEVGKNELDKTFDSKFVDMLLKNDLVTNSGNDIILLLKKNNINKNIIEYVDKKLKEI